MHLGSRPTRSQQEKTSLANDRTAALVVSPFTCLKNQKWRKMYFFNGKRIPLISGSGGSSKNGIMRFALVSILSFGIEDNMRRLFSTQSRATNFEQS